MFVNKKILIIADYDPNRNCGSTIHLNYLKKHFSKQNSVELQNKTSLKQIRKYDIIWFRSEKNFLKLILICLVFKNIMIYDMASFPWLELKAENRSWFRVNTSLFVFKLASKVTQIRVLSFAMKDYIVQHLHIPSERVFVLNIPVEIDTKPGKNQSNNKIRFLYTGSNRIWQGLPNLVEAFKKIESDSRFVLECYGVKLQNTKNIHFYKSINHDKLIDIISRYIDVVVVPRDRNEITETVMPIKYAEAIYLNKYILAIDLKVLHEIANEKVVFIKNNEIDSLINGIKSFIDIV